MDANTARYSDGYGHADSNGDPNPYRDHNRLSVADRDRDARTDGDRYGFGDAAPTAHLDSDNAARSAGLPADHHARLRGQ